jgi:ankyrin repeat protein
MPEFMEDAVQAYCTDYKVDLPLRTPLILFGGGIQKNETSHRPKNVGLLIPLSDVSKIPSFAGLDAKILLADDQRFYCFFCKSFSLSNLFEIIRLFFPVPLKKWQLKIQFQLVHPLTVACLYYHGANLGEVVASLLENRPDDVDFISGPGYNALHYVCQYYAGDNLIEIVKLLIENKIDLNATTTTFGHNALHLACAFGGDSLIQIIKILLDSGLKVNAKTDNTGANALHIVCTHYARDDLFDIVCLLIEKGIEIKAVDEQGFNALHFVCRYYRGSNLLQIVRLLVIDHGVDVNIETKDGMKAIDILQFFNKDLDREDVLRFLVIRGLYNDT